jgi:microcystin-dependent protein
MKRTLLAAAIAATIACGASAQEAYMGQILQFGSTYCPRGTIPASGQTLAIAPNAALFSLFGTIYGGDGQTTFAMPDLRAKDANGQPIAPGQPGAGMLHCVVEQGYYPPRD